MKSKESNDLRMRIMESAKQEFTEKGFKESSLRRIVFRAGCSTGAVYTQFGSKSKLFDAIVYDVFHGIKEMIFAGTDQVMHRDDGEDIFEQSFDYYLEFLDFAYEHYDQIFLLVNRSEGTIYANLLEEMVQYDYKESIQYVKIHRPEKYDELLSLEYEYKTYARFTIQAMLMPFIDEMTYERAKSYYEKIFSIFLQGWKSLGIF